MSRNEINQYNCSNARANNGEWPEQLYVSHDKEKQGDMVNCTMCPHFRKVDSPNDWIVWWNFCRHFGGKIREPEISWCKTGVACIWLTKAEPKDAVELLARL
jgi:hypothetical protein